MFWDFERIIIPKNAPGVPLDLTARERKVYVCPWNFRCYVDPDRWLPANEIERAMFCFLGLQDRLWSRGKLYLRMDHLLCLHARGTKKHKQLCAMLDAAEAELEHLFPDRYVEIMALRRRGAMKGLLTAWRG